MSQTTSSPGPIPPPTFDFQTYQSYAHQVQEGFVIVGLLGGLYGVLAILTLMAGYTLLTRQSRRAQPTSIVLCLTVFALFTSTTVYIVTSIIYYQSVSLNIAILSGTSLWSHSSAIEFSNLPKQLFQDNIATARLQACAAPATLTVNVVLGDGIVCWRACVVWYRNALVKAIVGIFLLATFVLGVFDTAQSCQPPRSLDSSGNFTPERPTIGIAACVLSLSTNLLATFLVAYKARESRMRVKQFLVVGPNTTRVRRVLMLLIESGALYSTLWLLIVAFQIMEYIHFNEGSGVSASEARFLGILNVVVHGVLIPLIAIYPATIIVLVTLNRSQVEEGLMQHSSSVPTSRFVVNVETITISRRDGRSLEAPVIGGQLGACDDGHHKDVSRHTSEERNVEKVV